MLSSGLRKVMKAFLILLAAPWITTDANATSEVSTARLDPKRVIERSESAIERTVGAYRLKNFVAEIDAVRPATDDAFALVLPEVNASTMDIFLDRLAACLAQNIHAIVLLDQAGWHGKKALAVPV